MPQITDRPTGIGDGNLNNATDSGVELSANLAAEGNLDDGNQLGAFDANKDTTNGALPDLEIDYSADQVASTTTSSGSGNT